MKSEIQKQLLIIIAGDCVFNYIHDKNGVKIFKVEFNIFG